MRSLAESGNTGTMQAEEALNSSTTRRGFLGQAAGIITGMTIGKELAFLEEKISAGKVSLASSKPSPRRDVFETALKTINPLEAKAVKAQQNTLANGRALPESAIDTEQDPAMTSLMKAYAYEKLGAPGTTGYRVSDAWKGKDGFWYQAYQGAILQTPDKNTPPVLWNPLDQMHEYGLDPMLDNGSLGVTIPPMEDFNDGVPPGHTQESFDIRVQHFNVPPNIVSFVENLRKTFETGVFTSHGKDYGPYVVWRTERMAFQLWKVDSPASGAKAGDIERILAGDAAKKAGLVPGQVQLASPDLIPPTGLGGGNTETPPAFQPEYGDIQKDGWQIINHGTKHGFSINPQAQAELTAIARKYEPNHKPVLFETYDDWQTVPELLVKGIQPDGSSVSSEPVFNYLDEYGNIQGLTYFAYTRYFEQNGIIRYILGFSPKMTDSVLYANPLLFNYPYIHIIDNPTYAKERRDSISKETFAFIAALIEFDNTLPPTWPYYIKDNVGHTKYNPDVQSLIDQVPLRVH
ncbi:hypothetical protein M1615_01100 [Patescibacteria group bacterium]|nr:hypothetical protein [Patescibacteria group bacterium]MCL5010475.1 hypothetical protein [Patescibacteria group bacterium]